MQPFSSGARAAFNLINMVQVHCDTDTRVVHLLKVLYSTDGISEQVIIYWAHKGAKPLVDYLESKDKDEE